MAKEVNVLDLVKDEQRYVFLYDDESSTELIQQFSRYARHPDLNFDWHDAMILSWKIRSASFPLKENHSRKDQAQ